MHVPVVPFFTLGWAKWLLFFYQWIIEFNDKILRLLRIDAVTKYYKADVQKEAINVNVTCVIPFLTIISRETIHFLNILIWQPWRSNNSYVFQKNRLIECCCNHSAHAKSPVAGTPGRKMFFARFLLMIKRSQICSREHLAPEHSILVRIFSINCLVRLNYTAVEVEQVFMYDL